MPDPRYIPRSFAADRSYFGKRENIKWNDADKYSDVELDRLVASQCQHRWAFAVNERVHFDYDSLADYARFADVNYVRLGGILRGEAVMRLEDVAMTQRTLGIALTPS